MSKIAILLLIIAASLISLAVSPTWGSSQTPESADDQGSSPAQQEGSDGPSDTQQPSTPSDDPTNNDPEDNTSSQPSNPKILPPEKGCYIGVFPGWGAFEDTVSAQELKDFMKLSGRSVVICPFSNFLGQNQVGRKKLDDIASCGAIPLLRFMPWGPPYWEPDYQPEFSHQKIIDGKFDQLFIDWADEIKGFGKPVMVSFAGEMNGDWLPWGGINQGGGKTSEFGDPNVADGPERYVAAHRHIVDLFRERKVDNVTWLFHPSWLCQPQDSWNTIMAYYPGDEYVDWVGTSMYGAIDTGEAWYGFEELMDPVYDEFTSLFPNKPLMLAEWGVGEWPDKGDKAEWYREALSKLQSKYTLIKMAIVYHDRWGNQEVGWSDLRINSSQGALEAYREGVRSDYFLDEMI